MMNILSRLRTRTVSVTSGPRKVAASRYGHGDIRLAASRILTRLCTGQDGSSLVETALVIFILMTPVLLGVFSVCMALVSYQQLNYAVMTATQTVAAGRNIITDPCKTVASSITSQLSGWTAANFTYTVTITTTVDGVSSPYSSGAMAGTTAATCGGSSTSSGNGNYALTNAIGGANGNPVQVNVSYTYKWFPLFGKAISGTLKAQETLLVS